MVTRRTLLQTAAVGVASALGDGAASALLAAPRRPLIDGVASACRRLTGHGWRDLVLAATGGELDIRATDLRRELGKPLTKINREIVGLADFAPGATRAIEPGNPAGSLLYHLFASPDVVEDGSGKALRAFPSLAEIEAVENYVYGAKPPSVADLRARAEDKPLAIVVFAVDYRRGADAVHGRHADLCFSRTGIARTGTIGPHYDPRQRAFAPIDVAQPFAFRAIPQRFAAYIAVKTGGDQERHGPRDFLKDDGERQFWVPLHKLFDGPECIWGRSLRVDLARHLRNEKLRRLHRYLAVQGFPSNWSGDDLDRHPFLIRDEMIASLSRRPEFGTGMLEPRPAPLASRAGYRGRPLNFDVPPAFVGDAGVMYFSTAQILPGPVETEPSYSEGLAVSTDRPAPEYLSVRYRVRDDGSVENLNQHPDMMKILDAGGYKAPHFIDFSGDGWIEARCPQIAQDIPTRVPAYALVAPPDFFPLVSQRDLTHWWRREVPEALRNGLWAIPPIPLSERRMAGNINLPAGFSIQDTTITALVSHPTTTAIAGEPAARPSAPRYSGLPDHSPGVFDPGWDTSQGVYYTDPDVPVQQFMQNYGLGTPFVEDVKLCAALGSYWPAVAPDSARTFTPHKRGPRFPYAWPTVVPLTDEETGIVPIESGAYMPWDGVRGPRVVDVGGRQVVAYPDIDRVDYLNNLDKLTAALLAKIDLAETKARVLAMAAVYWSLGIRPPDIFARYSAEERGRATIEVLAAKAAWAVLSFRNVGRSDDAELRAAEQATSARLEGHRRYRFHVYRPGEQTAHPSDLATVLVALQEQVVAYVGGGVVLLRRGDEPWQRDTTIPTS